MAGTGNDKEFLVVSFQFLERIFRKITGMSFFTMNHEDRAFDFVRIGQKRHIHEGQGTGQVPSVIGVRRPGMIASLCFVIVIVILHKLRRICRKRIYHTAVSLVVSISIIQGSLFIKDLPSFHSFLL